MTPKRRGQASRRAGLRRRRRPPRHSAVAPRRACRGARLGASWSPTACRPAGRQGPHAVGPGRRGRGEDPAGLGRHLPAAAASCSPRLAELRDGAGRPRPRGARRHGRLVARARGDHPHRSASPLTVLDTTDPAPDPRGAGRPAGAHASWSWPASPAARSRPTATGGPTGRRSPTRADRGRGRPALRRRHRPGLAAGDHRPRDGRARLPGRPRRRRPLLALTAFGAGAQRRWPASTSPSCSTRPRSCSPALADDERQPRRSRSARRSAPPRRPAATRSRWSPTAPASSASATGPSSSSPSPPARTARASCRS